MISRSIAALALGLGSLLSTANAQTYTDCDPTKRQCKSDPALGTNATFNFRETAADEAVWTRDAGYVDYTTHGGDFTIERQGDSVTIISKFYLFFGSVSVELKAARGQGIVSSFVMESDDLDEIDWELIGGNETHVQTNYFGKGNTTTFDRAIWHEVDKPMDKFVNYTTLYNSDQIEWYIEDKLVRTLPRAEASPSENYYPQTPMVIRMGVWAGGDPKKNAKGTVEWAGGEVNWDDAPFTMSVGAIHANDFSTGKAYKYTDTSGSWESIKAVKPDEKSEITKTVEDPEGVQENFDSLSPTAKIAIISVVCGVVAIGAAVIAFCCYKQRRAGRREQQQVQDELEHENNEMATYRQMMSGGNFAHGSRQ